MSNATYTYDDDCYSDLYKDVYGFRPRGAVWEHWENMTPAEKQVQWDYLCNEIHLQVLQEREEQAQAAIKFEKRVEATIACGAQDRNTALRWIYNADCGEVPEGCIPDWDYLCYHNNLKYGYFKDVT